jgi:hypothetical protein
VRPQRVVLTVVSLAAAAAALWRGDLSAGTAASWWGDLPALGLLAVAVTLLVSAVVLPTVKQVEFGFPIGVRVTAAVPERAEQLRDIFAEQRADLELCAQLLCDEPSVAAAALESAWSDTTCKWRGPVVDEQVRTYVLCVLVELVRTHHRWRGAQNPKPQQSPLSRLPWDQRVTVVLHDFARLPAPRIAELTGSSVCSVREALDQSVRFLDALSRKDQA